MIVPSRELLTTAMLWCVRARVLERSGWAARHHPDPTGEQLRQLVPVLRVMVECCSKGFASYAPNERPRKWGVVWDFMSLPQRGYTSGYNADADDRTPYQLARFSQGLKGINVWYGHEYTVTLVCDWPMPEGAENAASIDKRGWCIFERSLSSVRKDGRCCLALSQMPQDREELDWIDVCMACVAGRLAPPTPDAFEAKLREGMANETIRFTNGKDATNICIPQYREGFKRLMAKGGPMFFSRCEWTDADVEQLAAALKYAHAEGATAQADELSLIGNRLTAAALPPLVEAIAAGAMPELKKLYLNSNQLGDEFVKLLVALLDKGGLANLETLALFDNAITNAGMLELANAIARGGLPRCWGITLRGNPGSPAPVKQAIARRTNSEALSA